MPYYDGAHITTRPKLIRSTSVLLNIEESQLQPDIVLLRCTGRIVVGRDSQQIEWKVADLIRDKVTRVIFDLSGVDFLDSTGIGIIVMCSGKLKDAGGQLRLAGASGIVDKTLRLTAINNIVPFHTTVDEAAAAFPSGRQAAGS
jgi:anti-sigma B factor antagonist